MADGKSREKDPANPETDAARRNDDRNTGESVSEDLAGEDRFTEEDGGERGYRGNKAPDTPPGSVPGGSYGGGGGVQQGGFERGGLDDVAEAASPDDDAARQDDN